MGGSLTGRQSGEQSENHDPRRFEPVHVDRDFFEQQTDTRPVISPVAQAMLIKFGSLVSAKSGEVRLVRA
jgi:hypothetical protein